MAGTYSGSCPLAGIGISGDENLSSDSDSWFSSCSPSRQIVP